jgi:small subunit ribosomal protein S6
MGFGYTLGGRLNISHDRGRPFVELSIRRYKNMANYESVLIARQDLGASQVNTLVEELTAVIKAEGGEVVKVDNWGLKNLAYRIKKNRKGYYVLLNIVAPATAVSEYERRLRLNEDVIRYMTVKVNEFNNEVASDEELAEAVEA